MIEFNPLTGQYKVSITRSETKTLLERWRQNPEKKAFLREVEAKRRENFEKILAAIKRTAQKSRGE